jgi:uncharacterized membrane protein HdeD (DUF308 family)
MTTLAPSSEQATGSRSRWKWFLGLGVLLVLLGLAGAGATTLLELASVLVFGPMLLASSILQLLMAFFAGPQPVPNQHCQEKSNLEGRRDDPSPTRKWLASWPVPTKESMIHYMDAGLEAVLGFLIMAHPLAAVTDLTVLVAVFLMLRGLVRLIRSSITHSWSALDPHVGRGSVTAWDLRVAEIASIRPLVCRPVRCSRFHLSRYLLGCNRPGRGKAA